MLEKGCCSDGGYCGRGYKTCVAMSVDSARLEAAAPAELREVKLDEARIRRQLSLLTRKGCCSNTPRPLNSLPYR